MSKKLRMLVVAGLAAIIGLAFGGSALAQLGDLPGMDQAAKATGGNTGGLVAPAVGQLGNADHGPCVEQLLDLPALGSCKDAEGRIIMDLPALTLVSPRELPATGINVGDFAAIGGVLLAAGFVLTRRFRVAMAS
jgi:LPXTG-motif cell wall-anchored protein